ncbi:hypothetical protein B0H11DRAFT_1908185 [Mycena galericulata]|nr:hypothetical protein B0H11DRAFT_1908185 [Mycena galericulata]
MMRTRGLRARLCFPTPAAAAHGTLDANSHRRGACGFGFGLKGPRAAARARVGSRTVAKGRGVLAGSREREVDIRTCQAAAGSIHKKYHTPNPVLNWVRGESEGKSDGISMRMGLGKSAYVCGEQCHTADGTCMVHARVPGTDCRGQRWAGTRREEEKCSDERCEAGEAFAGS